MIQYPSFDPVAFRLGPLAVRWYGIAYLLGFVCGYGVLRRAGRRGILPLDANAVGDLLTWIVVGVILGGRLGYVLFYNLGYFLDHPLKVFAVWEGGMAFHGALIGVAVATWLFSRSRGVPFLRVGDGLALAAPPGLFFGRLANFINGELFGRPSHVPWAMVFPEGGPLPRHPSQLYEAVLEGPLLWAVVLAVAAFRPSRPGRVAAAFLLAYGVFRFLVEFTREPDAQLGFILGPFTMGQALSATAFLGGLLVFWAGSRAPLPPPAPGTPKPGGRRGKGV
jgi:phosphatidylglycerol:prolipoprotein diacylglycerol transferase